MPVNLNHLIEQAVLLTQPKWKDEALAKGATVKMDCHLEDVPIVAGNEAELREVLTNLIFNAVDALPEGGTIAMATSAEYRIAIDPNPASPEPSATPTSVILRITDNGTGMTEEVRKHCLEPFFTTKGKQGTGLGLAMVAGIIRRHGGIIDTESEVGKGTRFAIRLPAQPELRAAANPPNADRLDAPLRPLRILVVDDEALIRRLLVQHLTGDGHKVETAVNGVEALQKFHAGRFDLVLTDRAMPQMSGDQLAVAIKKAAPDKAIIMLTGFGDLMIAAGTHPEGVDVVLSKPVSPTALRQALSRAIATEHARR
jgi:CheY-like chemotaxis protein